MAIQPRLAFWFDFASSYSYLSALRIERLCAAAGVAIDWRPFLLGPIFAAQGWTTSPFNIYAAKGRYMVRDIERRAADLGRAFCLPDPFPAASVAAARIAVAHQDQPWIGAFTRAVFEAQFERGADIGDEAVLRACLAILSVDAAAIMAASMQRKSSLRSQTEQAIARGIFGAPTFVTTDGELFWGDDRLEQAIAWELRGRPPA